MFLVFDLTSKISFEKCEMWIKEVKRHLKDEFTVLVGNKKDMEEKRGVDSKEIEKFCKENKLIYLETSAKDFLHVQKVFRISGMLAFEFHKEKGKGR